MSRLALGLVVLGVVVLEPGDSFFAPTPSLEVGSRKFSMRQRGVLYSSLRPPNDGNDDKRDRKKWGGSGGLGGGRRREEKKENTFSKDHFYQGKVGIGTYAWGDESRGYFEGDYPVERSTLPCGSFNRQDVAESFDFLEENGMAFFDTIEMTESEEILGDLVAQWRKKQIQLSKKGKQVRPFVATTYNAKLFGAGGLDLRGGRRAVIRGVERSLEHLQMTRLDLYQVTKPSRLYWGGEAALFEAVADAKQMRLLEHAGVVGYRSEDLGKVVKVAGGFGVDLKSNSFELNLANPSALVDGTVDACKKAGMTPFAYRPLGGGLVSGLYTMLDPAGGLMRKPRYSFHDLEPYYPIHKALKEMATKYMERLGKRVSPAQVSLNWVRAKGAVPIVGIKNANQAIEINEATKWDLDPEDVAELEEAAFEVYRKRRRLSELLSSTSKGGDNGGSRTTRRKRLE